MNKERRLILAFFTGLLFFLFGAGDNGFSLWAKSKNLSPKPRLLLIEDQVLPDRLRVILKTSQPVSHRSFTLTAPYRVVVDLSPCVLEKGHSFKIKDPSIERLRFSQFNKKTVRVVFTFSRPATYHISTQKEKGYFLFADFPKIEPLMAKPLLPKKDRDYLPEMTIEEFKKEKNIQEYRHKEEKSLSKKPLVTFDFYMTNLHNVLRLIGETGGVNIVVGDDVKEKKVTLSLKEVPWDEALDSILDASNLKRFERGEKTYLVTTNETYKKLRDEENRIKNDELKNELENLKIEEQRQKIGKVPWKTKQFQIKNIDVAFIEKKLEEVEKKEALQSGRSIAGSAVGTGATLSLEKTIRWTGVTLISVPHTNNLIVKGTEKDIEYIGELIKAIDQPLPQVMIEARIVEADTNFTRDLGIRWGGAYSYANANAPFAGTIRGGEAGASGSNYAVNLPLSSTSTAFGGLGIAFAGTNFNLDARLQVMEKEGRGKTISAPKILTKPDNEAVIKQGQSIPVTTRDQNNAFTTIYRDAALVLKVTPQIASSKKIRIKVFISKNEPDFTKVDSIGNPTINMKEAETEMIVNDGDTVVIGGIIFKKETYQVNKVPGLADIPLLGWLFKSQYKSTDDTELLIFLTPKIKRDSTPENALIEN